MKIEFKNSKGQKLVGDLSEFDKDYVVIHCHGYGTSMLSSTAVSIKNTLTEKKISCLIFDFSGFGESDGNEKDVTISGAIDDLTSAVKYLKSLGFKKFVLSGSSFGGGVVLNYLTQNHDIVAAVLKAPVSDYNGLSLKVLEDTEKSEKFLKDAQKCSIYNKAASIQCPVLILHGDKDIDVPLGQSQRTALLIPNCRLIIIKGGNHKLADHQNLFLKEVVQFLESFR